MASSGGEDGRDHERRGTLAGRERLELCADRGVALLGARVAAAHAIRSGTGPRAVAAAATGGPPRRVAACGCA